jgi:hypothetical protein
MCRAAVLAPSKDDRGGGGGRIVPISVMQILAAGLLTIRTGIFAQPETSPRALCPPHYLKSKEFIIFWF